MGSCPVTGQDYFFLKTPTAGFQCVQGTLWQMCYTDTVIIMKKNINYFPIPCTYMLRWDLLATCPKLLTDATPTCTLPSWHAHRSLHHSVHAVRVESQCALCALQSHQLVLHGPCWWYLLGDTSGLAVAHTPVVLHHTLSWPSHVTGKAAEDSSSMLETPYSPS